MHRSEAVDRVPAGQTALWAIDLVATEQETAQYEPFDKPSRVLFAYSKRVHESTPIVVATLELATVNRPGLQCPDHRVQIGC
jgi:hypothetical protein